MEILVAALCDAATEENGKLNILGTFDTICVPNLPAVHRQCVIALRMLFSKAEEGRHRVTLSAGDDDGKPLLPAIEIPVDVAIPDDAIHLSRNLIVSIQSLKFDRAGHFAINIAINGRQRGSIPLSVRPARPSSPADS